MCARMEPGGSRLPPPNAIDNVETMKRRKALSSFAEQPVNFIYEGLKKIQECTKLTSQDVICDVGSSDGEATVLAAQNLDIPSFLVGIDPSEDALVSYICLRRSLNMSRFALLKGYSEDIVLPANAVRATMAHNSIFRSSNISQTLHEYRRITEPNGLIVISTNGRANSRRRHTLECLIAVQTSLQTHLYANRIRPPAYGAYWEELPCLLNKCGYFMELFRLVQDSRIIYEPGERLDTLVASLKDTFAASGLPEQTRPDWDQATNSIVEQYVWPSIKQFGCYIDPVLRGMIVVRNIK